MFHLKDDRVCWGGEGQAVPTLVGSSRSLKWKYSDLASEEQKRKG